MILTVPAHRRALLRAFGAAAFISAAFLPGLASAEVVVVKHAKGELSIESPPKKVAVFDLAALDIIDALGVDAVAGLPRGEDGAANVPGYLSAYNDPKFIGVGTLFEPDLAALKALAPDLIIISGRSASKYDAVKDIAPTLDLSPAGGGLVADTIANTLTLGQVFGAEDAAAAKIAELTTAVATMQAAVKDDDTALVLFAVAKTSMAHAPGQRFGTLYDYLGMGSVMDPIDPNATAAPRPEPGSPEAEAARQRQLEARDAALAAEPDWIITLDRAAISSPQPSDVQDRLSKDPAIAVTKAWQAGKVIHLDPRGWYLVGTGIQNLTLTAQAITAQLSAEAADQ
ncbi:ABC transporter substrate-binding protein [Xinfangfangia sp. CPCC 101601]|uniref:ABC transporter substrate-binding protein n=1 Tax=Pseudogemmobacter lacusdianii TaxID=3069608 RepID=A0ABU0W1G5_9RHOB|nr:ABC transporter substrate-binding protein [Xinfangfangia sp. CPCC 101601]MDQ2067865.1 ABC transporter substrate-binding protein [Xinfangfangia sp. CPCC 101601]